MSQAEFAQFQAWKASNTMSTIPTQTAPVVVVNKTPMASPGDSPAVAETTPVSVGLTDILSILPASVMKAFANVVSTCHKEIAFVMGVLAAFDVVPTTNATTEHLGAALLLGYTAVTHAANAIGAKKVA